MKLEAGIFGVLRPQVSIFGCFPRPNAVFFWSFLEPGGPKKFQSHSVPAIYLHHPSSH